MSSTRTSSSTTAAGAGAAKLVLLVLASGQFLMTLDSSVMNVSISQVASDLGTTVTGIQTAITLYTLVMAAFMITGGKLGGILGRRRAFAIGLVIYASGSLTTALAPNLGVLIFGWSFLEGLGAALIMPAIVALVAGNFPAERRPTAYGLIAAAGAMAVAAGPLIGGAVTTFWSWRWVFAGEVVVVIAILSVVRKIKDTPVTERPHLDLVGSGFTIVGLSMVVFGVLRSGAWGWVRPAEGGPELIGLSPVFWLVAGGIAVLFGFVEWERHVVAAGREPLVRLELFGNGQLTGGLTMFFFQFMVQASAFFVIPLFLSVVLELSALDTGIRLLPLSAALLVAAAGIPKAFPHASPRKVVRWGLLLIAIGLVVLVGALELGADATIVTVPLLFMGLGMGALASQLGAVTVSALPDKDSADVGGLQNTVTNLGASLGTALVGSILIASLTATFLSGIQNNPDVPASVSQQASVELVAGIPFVSDTQLDAALQEAGVPADVSTAVVDENEQARLVALRTSLAVVALFSLVALFFTRRIPDVPVGTATATTEAVGAGA